MSSYNYNKILYYVTIIVSSLIFPLFFSPLIKQIMTKSNLVVMLDDAKMSSSLEELMVQIQGGLMGGSLKSGLTSSVGSLLISANHTVDERLVEEKSVISNAITNTLAIYYILYTKLPY